MKTKPNRQRLYRFLWIQLTAVGIALSFFLLSRIAVRIGKPWFGCVFHDRLFLYCPMCGGTRAVTSLLRLDFATALASNAYVTILVLLLLILDGIELYRILSGRPSIRSFPVWVWIVALSALVVFAVVRNVLLVCFGVDSLGDLAPIWHFLR